MFTRVKLFGSIRSIKKIRKLWRGTKDITKIDKKSTIKLNKIYNLNSKIQPLNLLPKFISMNLKCHKSK